MSAVVNLWKVTAGPEEFTPPHAQTKTPAFILTCRFQTWISQQNILLNIYILWREQIVYMEQQKLNQKINSTKEDQLHVT